MRDELRQPLQRRTLATRLWSKRPGPLALAYALTLAIAGLGAWYGIKTPNPFAGEPVVYAKIPVAEEIATASTEPAEEPAASANLGDGKAEEAASRSKPKKPPYTIVPLESAPEQETIAEEPQQKQQQVAIVTTLHSALTPAPNPDVTENLNFSDLPRISDTGKRPSKVYARSTPMNVLHSDQPKVAIILGGMGLNPELTRRAARDLPAEVTFAFAPYGEDLQNQVNDVRKLGHEVLLQVPLEPMGYPQTSPGPKTLLADGKAADNIKALHWHMARFAGYTGVINYMGGRFLANPDAVKPLLSELKKRGLYFYEDGNMANTAVRDVAKMVNGPSERATLVLDGNNDAQAVAASLAQLESEAGSGDVAIATGTGLPDTIDAIKDWAKDATERGVALVPASAAFQPRSG